MSTCQTCGHAAHGKNCPHLTERRVSGEDRLFVCVCVTGYRKKDKK